MQRDQDIERLIAALPWYHTIDLGNNIVTPGPYHGVLHAYKTTAGWRPRVVHRDALIARQRRTLPREDALAAELAAKEREIAQLKALVEGYERGRFIRFMGWLDSFGR